MDAALLPPHLTRPLMLPPHSSGRKDSYGQDGYAPKDTYGQQDNGEGRGEEGWMP